MVFVFDRAERIGHPLDVVGLAVRPVVHRIDHPLVAGALMSGLADPVHHRIAHVDVARRHVDLGAQHVRAVLEFTGAHAAEQIEILVDRASAVRALASGLGERAAIFANLVGRQAVDVRLAVTNELLGPLIQLLEIVRRVVEVLAPVEAQPADVALDSSTYSCDSLTGLVSSKRRLQRPPNSCAMPKSIAMALAWPMCRRPLGSGGNRVTIVPPSLPERGPARRFRE